MVDDSGFSTPNMNIGMSDPYSTWAGIAVDAVNAGANIGFGIYDRDYSKQLNNTAQQNWIEQMNFARQQYNRQVEIQERNRIGHLAKEYSEVGLNPLLAAGLGSSTAGVVAGAGQAGLHGYQPQSIQASRLQNMQIMSQLSMQKALNDATIEKLKSEANLNNTQSEDIKATQEYRIDKLQADYNLTQNQAEQVIKVTNKINSEIKKVEAETKNIHETTVGKIIENGIEAQYGKKLQQDEIYRIEQEVKTARKNNRLNTWKEVRSWCEMFLANAIKAGNLAVFAGRYQ